MATIHSADSDGRGAGGGFSRPNDRVLSCVNCRKRKIRCNRVIPCAHCLKNDIICIPSKPAPARSKVKTAAAVLQERLTKCETLLQKYVAVEGYSTGESLQTNGAKAGSQNENSLSVGETVSIQTRAPVDGELWTTLNDQIQKMRELIEQDLPEGLLSEEVASPDPSESSSPSSSKSAPLDPVTIFKLWQIFLDHVNPLIKIIHAPTMQPFIVSAAADINSLPLDQQALLYSIFGLAVLSLRTDEVTSVMGDGRSREVVLQEILQSASVVIVRFDSLKRYNVVILQALIHISIILMAQCNKHASWILSGSIIRIAMSMGYHRDGTHFSLSPFETEMRRRIWWQIVLYDIKLGIDIGLTQSYIPKSFDTKQPLNLNDADLFRDATSELVSRDGPTEMAFILVMNRLTAYLLDEDARRAVESNILGLNEGNAIPASLERNRVLIQELEADLLDIEKRFVDLKASNVHAAALGIRPQLIKRLYDMMNPMQESPDWGVHIFSPRDNLFKLILQSCENARDSYDLMNKWGFSWYIHLHFNLDLITSLSTFLYHSPTGSLADRGWAVFESLYVRNSLLHHLTPNPATHFVLKAFAERERALADSGQFFEVPEIILNLRQIVKSPLVMPPVLTIPDQWTDFGTVAGVPTDATQFMNMFMPFPGGSEESEGYNFWSGVSWSADLAP